MYRYELVERQILTGTVMAVHDGDSYKVKFKDETVWIRLYGCDTPEVISNYVTKDQPFGRLAGNKMRELLKGNEVKVEVLFKDQYGRWICKIWFNDIDLTEYVVKNGFGWHLREPKMKTSYFEGLKIFQEQSKVQRLGLWGETGRKVRPSTWREQNRRFTLNENITKEFPELW